MFGSDPPQPGALTITVPTVGVEGAVEPVNRNVTLFEDEAVTFQVPLIVVQVPEQFSPEIVMTDGPIPGLKAVMVVVGVPVHGGLVAVKIFPVCIVTE